jgi:hypothetical protein
MAKSSSALKGTGILLKSGSGKGNHKGLPLPLPDVQPLSLPDGVCNPVRNVSLLDGVCNPVRNVSLLDGVCNPVRNVSALKQKRYGAGCKPAPAKKNVTEQVANLLRQKRFAAGRGLQPRP